MRAAVGGLAEKCSELGYSADLTKKILVSLMPNEPQPAKFTKSQSIGLKSVDQLQSSLVTLSMNDLYSRYIDRHSLYKPVSSRSDLEHLVSLMQSDFGKDHASTRSFSRSKKDAFRLEKKFKPGPGSYNPKALAVRASSPSLSITRSRAERLQYRLPYSPGPGAYKPLTKILSRRS